MEGAPPLPYKDDIRLLRKSYDLLFRSSRAFDSEMHEIPKPLPYQEAAKELNLDLAKASATALIEWDKRGWVTPIPLTKEGIPLNYQGSI